MVFIRSQEDPMDLSFSKEEVAFRDEVRNFFKDNVPSATRQKLQEGRHLSKQEMIDWWRILNKKGWGVSHWPKEYGGTVAACFWRQHGRPRHLHLRQRGAEKTLSAAHRQRRRLVVPGFFGARLRLRSRLAENQGRAQGGFLRRQRPENLDHAGAARRLDLLSLPHRSLGQEAVGHLVHPDRHEDQRHHGASDPDHRWWF